METSVLGRMCLTTRSHEAERPNELGYKEGDLVTLASELMEDNVHYQAVASDGSMGLIPHSALLERRPIPPWPMPWFHGGISRLDAEKLLDRNLEGQFLLRTSQNTKGVYALALSHGGQVNHYLVAMDFSNQKLTIDGSKYFDHLPELVEAHARDVGSLACLLTHPLTRRGVLDFHIDLVSLKSMWGVPKSEVELGETLGQGEFGEVRLATYRDTQVAAKIILEEKQNASNTASFLQEAAILTQLQHQNLVQLVGLVFQGSAMKCILMELMGKGSLQKYLISRGRSVVSRTELLSFARDVCEGMLYISSHGFVHRDLAARNVLLNSNGQAKISDFGLARRADLHVPHEGGKFPVKWTAPEALKESKFSVKSDVWSYGILLWEIYSYGRVPYPAVPATEVLGNIEDGISMDPPDHCPDTLYDLMCDCWEIEPDQRPTFLSLQQQLARVSQDSSTPGSSPMIPRKPSMHLPNVDELVNSPAAVKAYREAPINRKTTMFLCNMFLIGPQASGKTSLLRSLMGENFRLVEPPSQRIDITESYTFLTENLSWLPSSSGLVYEDELVRIIVEDLLKHTHTVLSHGFPSPMCGGDRPPLPPPRQRSHSFTEMRRNVVSEVLESDKAVNRLSGNFELLETASSVDKLEMTGRPKHLHVKKNPLTKFLNRSFRGHHHTKEHKKVKRHHSDSTKHAVYTGGASPPSPSPLPPPPRSSPLPERITEKIKLELAECSGRALPPKYFARLIDTPGHPSFRVLQTLFLTENSLCLLVFDTSRDILLPPATSLSLRRRPSPDVKQNGANHHSPTCEDSYLLHIMAEISNVCAQWSGCKTDLTVCGPRIVLVGTHSDKVPTSVTHRNFEILCDEIKASSYEKYVAVVKFVVSNSSIIERSSMDDLKQFVKENVKRSCRQQVPLKWLRCVRRFQGLPKKRSYFVSLAEAKKLVSEICDISLADPEIGEVVNFLHQNQVIMHFPCSHHLRDLVISSTQWFSHQVSALFGAVSVDIAAKFGPLELLSDQDLLKSTGVLTSRLLDYVWREKESQVNKDELLIVMHKMDLLCCMASETHPVTLSASVEDLTAEVSTRRPQHRHKVTVSSLVVPALVEEPDPPHLASLPSYDVEPVMFRFKDHVPNGLFSRILVRCVQSYSKGFCLYQHSATFEVDDSSLLLLTEGRNYIRVTLHPNQKVTPSPSSPTSSQPNHAFSDIDSLLSDSASGGVTPDTCMAILMFVRASINDLTQQWTPHLDFDLCVKCSCKLQPIPMDSVVDIDAALAERSRSQRPRPMPSKPEHYIILNDVDSLLQQGTLHCDHGNLVPLTAPLLCWFGEVPATSISPVSPLKGDNAEYVTDEDINQVLKVLGPSWKELGKTLGFSQLELEHFSLTTSHSFSYAGKKMLEEWQTLHNRNATFFALLGALEMIQRRDIADDLVAARMGKDGFSL